MRTLATIAARLEHLRQSMPPATTPIAWCFSDAQEHAAKAAGKRAIRFHFLPVPQPEATP